MSEKRVACLVLLQSVRMEMGSFRKEFSEEKNFTLLSLYFFPLLPCPPTSFLPFVLLLPLFLVIVLCICLYHLFLFIFFAFITSDVCFPSI